MLRKVGHVARDGHIAQVTTAVDENGIREENGEQAKVHVIVGHLVDDPLGSSHVDALEAGQVLPCQAADGRAIKMSQAIHCWLGTLKQLGNRFERLSSQPELSRPMNGRVAGENLLDQGGSRAGKAEDEKRPARVRPTAFCLGEKGRGALGEDLVDNELMIPRRILASATSHLQLQGIGAAGRIGRARVVATPIKNLSQCQQEVRLRLLTQGRVASRSSSATRSWSGRFAA